MRTLTLFLLITIPFLASAQSKKDKQRYTEYIKTADSAFDAKNYPFAKSKYEAASLIKPKEEYPKTRIKSCDDLYVKQIADFKKYIAIADSAFDKKNFLRAKTYYLLAHDVKPNDQYSSDQAKNCNYHLVAADAMEERYEELIRKADSCFIAKSWACAKANYQSASNTKPEVLYPKERIVACDANMKVSVNNEKYEITIADADRQYDAGNYARAKQLYEEALTYKPGSKYATDRVKLCEEKMNEPK